MHEKIKTLEITDNDCHNKQRKLRARWSLDSGNDLEALSLTEKQHSYFHHGYSKDQPTMGFFYWEGADFNRVKSEYPDKMTTEEKEAVLKYMENSTEEKSYLGDSTSRIEGTTVFVGYKDMRTPDGKWIFPHNWDNHYVKKYNIAPTREFVKDAVRWSKNEIGN